MSIPSLLLAIGTLLVLELLILALRRYGRGFRGGVLFQGWAIAMALFLGLEGSEWAAGDPPTWQVICTATVMLTTLVIYNLFEKFVLVRHGDPARPPLIPRLLHQVIRFLLVLASFIFALNIIHGLPLPTVLVSSTVVSAVLGLALQDVLKNVFAGIALQLEGAPRVGDWLEIDGHPARVEAMTWRATHLRTNEGVDLIEPNSRVADRQLTVFGDGRRPVAFSFRVGLPYEAPPAQVRRALLAAASSSPGALDQPEPVALVRSYGDSAIEYELRAWTMEVDHISFFRSVVNSRIWYEIQRAGLYVPFPIRTVHLRRADRDEAKTRQQELARAVTLLARVGLFAGLPPEAHNELAARSRRLHFDQGEYLVREGDPGDSVFILDSGQVAVTKSGQRLGTSTIGLAALKEGDFFGEVSLLTGEPRTATVIATTGCEAIVLSKDALSPLLEAQPEIVEILSAVLVERTAATDEALELKKELSLSQAKRQRDPTTFVRKIRTFFRLP